MIQCKPASVTAAPEDGRRILIERQWPAGCGIESLIIDEWLPNLAPSAALLSDFNAQRVTLEQFSEAYRQALAAEPEHWWKLIHIAQNGTLTLVYDADAPATVLAQWLDDELERHQPAASPVCYLGELPGP